MKKIILAILIFLTIFTVNSSAEKIKLKNGLFFNGKINETTADTITVAPKFGKVATYKWDEVESIDEKSVSEFKKGFSSAPAPIEEQQEKVISVLPKNSVWEIWKNKTKEYYVNTEMLVKQANANFEDLRLIGISLTDEDQIIAAISNFREELQAQISHLKGIKPPSEFTQYHEYLLNHLNFLDHSQELLLSNDLEAANQFLQLSRDSYISAKRELRDIFKSQSAPQEIIEEMNKILQEYESAKQENKNRG